MNSKKSEKIQLPPVIKNKSKLSQINIPSSKKAFVKNERVMAVWAYNHKYPATVREVLPKDKYEVLFSDGYAKILRGCKLFKASEEDLRNVQIPPPKKPAPPMGADPYDPDLGPKEERRLKKRRLDVLESYRPLKKQKLDTSHSTPDTSPQPSTSYKRKEMPKVRLKMKERPKERERERDDSPEDEEDRYPTEDESQDQEDDFSEPETPVRRRRRKHMKKKVFDESTYVYRSGKHRSHNNTNERWAAEIPQGTSPVQIKDKEGYCRESVIIPDKKIPQGWTKHTMRRRRGAKWDVFLVNPHGRKFRSRNELRNYFAEQKIPFPEECFDFQVGRKMEMIQTQQKLRESLSEAAKKSAQKVSVPRKSERERPADTKKPIDDTPDRKIKTLLPKSRMQDAAESDQSTPSSSVSTPSFPLSELRTSDGGYTCCGKNFRKENLFQMHMKHYHPEYSNLFGASPNVADLAYARTSGGPLEDSRAEAMTPRSSLVERVNKYEAERKAHVDTPTSVSEKIQEIETSPQVEAAPEPIQPKVEKPEDEPPPSGETKLEEVTTTDDSLTKEEPVSASEEQTDLEANDSVDAPSPPEVPAAEESETETPEEKPEETPPVTTEPEPIEPEKPPSPPPPVTPRPIPIIRPVAKTQTPKPVVMSEPPPVQTPTSKPPVIITKYVPPGQKPPSSNLTKLTINTTSAEKENKPTIKTLLPMRPPSSETKEGADTTKSKDTKVKEEVEEEPNKSRPRKRTVSEPLIKKPKISKPTTGSLEEEPAIEPPVPPSPMEPPASPTATSTSYRFSRNRTQVPRVSLQKLNLTADNYGRVVLPSGEGNDSMLSGPDPAAEKVQVEPLPATDLSSENLRKEEIINCTCGYMEEDGLMIQCDLCLCWQHGLCNNIDKESDVPEKYVCSICQNPTRQRASTKYRHNQDWLKEGKLPSLPFRVKDEESVAQGELMLKKSHDLIASLLQLKTVIRSLRIKTNIVKRPDHPKLYLWAKSWKNDNVEGKPGSEDEHKTEDLGPKPEAAIDETECRLRLLEHVEDYQHQVEDRLTFIQAQIAALESEDPDLANDEAEDHCPVTKQTVQMLLTDLGTMRKVAALN